MDITYIEKYLDLKVKKSKVVNVHFKDRATVTGVFIIAKDYSEMKTKNFWRIVNVKNLQQWERTKNIEFSRLFNGASFTRLSVSAQ